MYGNRLIIEINKILEYKCIYDKINMNFYNSGEKWMKIRRNDLCPCGSGLKFKKCCETIENVEIKLNLRNIKNIKDSTKIKRCLYPDHTKCSEKIIDAHSIQNNKILKKISKNGEVYMPTNKKWGFIEGEMTKWGRKEATTFNGFCGYHDNEVFKEIENNDFNYSKEHVFLYTYRAFIFEYYKKIQNVEFHRKLITEYKLPTNSPEQLFLKGLKLSVEDLKLEKEIFDKAILEQNYDVLDGIILEINKWCNFACSGFWVLTKDIKNNQIQNIEDKDIKLKHVFLSIFPENDKTYIILSWTKQNSNIFREYKKQLEALTEQERKNYINNIIPLEIENVVVNPDSWEKLERGIKDSFGLAYNGAFIGFDKLIYENILQNPGYDFFSL